MGRPPILEFSAPLGAAIAGGMTVDPPADSSVAMVVEAVALTVVEGALDPCRRGDPCSAARGYRRCAHPWQGTEENRWAFLIICVAVFFAAGVRDNGVRRRGDYRGGVGGFDDII